MLYIKIPNIRLIPNSSANFDINTNKQYVLKMYDD